MRLPCPHCGERDIGEFVYRGDAQPVRPNPQADNAQAKFFDYVYLRDNPAGWMQELWYHEGGCRCWIVVERNTLTHAVRGAQLAAQSERGKAHEAADATDGEDGK